MTDDLREKVARAIHRDECEEVRQRGGQKGIDWVKWGSLPEGPQAHYLRKADAVLAVVDPDGLRAEVERLRSPGETDLLDRITDPEDLRGRVRAVMRALRIEEAHHRAAVREAAALREQVESLTEQVQTRRRYERLHAIKHHGARPLTDAERATYPDGYDPLANFPAARNPEAEALRAGVEAVLSNLDPSRAPYDKLRALLADPTPDGRMFVAAPDVEAGDNLPGSWTPQHRAPEAEQ